MPAGKTQYLYIGSLLCSIESEPEHYASVLAEVYGTRLFEGEVFTPIGLSIHIVERPVGSRGTSDALRVETVGDGYRLVTDPLTCRLHLRPGHPRAELVVAQPEMQPEQLAYHFLILSNRLLLLLDRMLLHAAAVHFSGRVNLFSGHKGAGKSTVSVALGQAGGTLLSEDHTILTKANDGFLVSGCSSRMRVTAVTEEELLPNQLRSVPVDIGGTPKKELRAEDFFDACPNQDHAPDGLFLTSVGASLSLRPASAREALLWMVDMARETFRFAKNEDYSSFLDMLAGFVASIPSYRLELSPDVSQVGRVGELLSDIPRPSVQ